MCDHVGLIPICSHQNEASPVPILANEASLVIPIVDPRAPKTELLMGARGAEVRFRHHPQQRREVGEPVTDHL